ncbi:MAG TPA: hypothetical protein VGM39_06325 [Kofleriaceae bacterium]|jgi:hypothetical protein
MRWTALLLFVGCSSHHSEPRVDTTHEGIAAAKAGNTAKAEQLLGTACASPFGDGCYNLGVLLEQQKRLGEAEAAYAKGCELEQMDACAGAGFLAIANGHSDLAQQRCEQSCNARNAEGCVCMGLATQPVQGQAGGDNDRAFTFYSKACDLMSARGCTFAGQLAAIKTPGSETRLFELGCDRGNAEGCVELGKKYAVGAGVERDNDHAIALFRKACAAGEPRGCKLLDQNGLPH